VKPVTPRRLTEVSGSSSSYGGLYVAPAASLGVVRSRISPWVWSTMAAIAFVAALGVFLPAWRGVGSLASDSYMTLYAGRWIALHGIPHHEVFTIAAGGRSWIDQQWLAELIDYETWRIGGYAGIALLSVGMIALSYAVLAALMLRRGASVVVTVCCCAIAILVALPGMFIRSQIFALVLFALLLVLCLSDAEHDRPLRRLILLLPLLALWANIHGSVLIGASLGMAYLLFRALMAARKGLGRSAVGCSVLALAVGLMPLATPYGLQIVHYYKAVLGNSAIAASVSEWRPPAFPDPSFFLFVVPLALVLASLTSQLIKRRRPSWVLVTATAATAVATAMARRNEVWFAMTAAVLIADSARTWLPTEKPSRAFVLVMTAAALGVASLGVGMLAMRTAGQYEALTPIRAITATAAYASHHPCVRILADNPTASALLWHDPSLAGRVAFDSRLEQYSKRALDRWIDFQLASGSRWLVTIRGYQVLMGSSTYPTLVQQLKRLPDGVLLAHEPRGIAVINGAPASRCTA
jgi:hypothetical protein